MNGDNDTNWHNDLLITDTGTTDTGSVSSGPAIYWREKSEQQTPTHRGTAHAKAVKAQHGETGETADHLFLKRVGLSHLESKRMQVFGSESSIDSSEPRSLPTKFVGCVAPVRRRGSPVTKKVQHQFDFRIRR